MYYRLIDGVAVPCSMMEWAMSWKGSDRFHIQEETPHFEVSTVWLGMDHAYSGSPLLFESMIFAKYPEDPHWGVGDDMMFRCETLEQAKIMHEETLELAQRWEHERQQLLPPPTTE